MSRLKSFASRRVLLALYAFGSSLYVRYSFPFSRSSYNCLIDWCLLKRIDTNDLKIHARYNLLKPYCNSSFPVNLLGGVHFELWNTHQPTYLPTYLGHCFQRTNNRFVPCMHACRQACKVRSKRSKPIVPTSIKSMLETFQIFHWFIHWSFTRGGLLPTGFLHRGGLFNVWCVRTTLLELNRE